METEKWKTIVYQDRVSQMSHGTKKLMSRKRTVCHMWQTSFEFVTKSRVSLGYRNLTRNLKPFPTSSTLLLCRTRVRRIIGIPSVWMSSYHGNTQDACFPELQTRLTNEKFASVGRVGTVWTWGGWGCVCCVPVIERSVRMGGYQWILLLQIVVYYKSKARGKESI